MYIPKFSANNKSYKKICTRISSSFRPYLLPSYVPVVLRGMNNHILTEGQNFKIFWKENYAIALDGCCLLTKKNVEHGIEHDIDSAYGVCKH